MFLVQHLLLYPLKVMQNINQANYDQDFGNQKIKTPAALFSKSSGKSPINRLRTQQSPASKSQKSFLIQSCANHPTKNASFQAMTDDEKLYFCQKCAITLASHGHNISRIQGGSTHPSPHQSASSNSRFRHNVSQSRKSRQCEILQFLQSLKQIRGTISQTQQTIKEKLIESQQFYGQQLQEVNDYFSLIIKSLELEKHKCYNHILNERQHSQQQIRKINGDLFHVDQDITKILLDIEDNMDTVYTIEEDMYKLVLSQYLTQQQEFSKCINGLLLEPIELRKIQFEGVPQSIYNISDVVIQNSMNKQESQPYRLIDSLNGEDFNNIRAISPDKQVAYNQMSNAESLKFSFEAERLKGQCKRGSLQRFGI